MVCRQAIRVPLFVTITSSYLVYLLWDLAPWRTALVVWAAVTIGAPIGRALLCRRILARADLEREIDRWAGFLVATAAFNGVVAGSAGWLFFSQDLRIENAFLTMILGCWSAAAISTSGAMPRAFLAFLFPFLVPVTASWLIFGGEVGLPLAVLLVLFAALEILFMRDSSREIEQSFRTRYENVALVGQLREKEAEARAARDRSENAAREMALLVEQLRQREAEANEARAVAENAVAARSRFLAAASHDLRQPVQALSLFSGALITVAKDATIRGYAEDIASAVRSLNGLFVELLDISTLEPRHSIPKYTRVDVRQTLERLAVEAAPLAREKNLELTIEADSGEIVTDQVLFERIVRNLVSNAIRYTEKGSIAVVAGTGNGACTLSVSDTGIGIAPEHHERVFEELFQVGARRQDGRRGIGLGLAIVRRIAEILGGEVELQSALGAGSTFTVRLPAKDGSLVETSGPPMVTEEVRGDPRGCRVLVLDDDAAVRRALRCVLMGWGCRVIADDDVESGLDMAEREWEQLDLIVTDLQLGEGRNGLDAVRSARELFPGVGALLVTGATQAPEIDEAKSCGIEVMFKPVEPERLRSAVVRLAAAAAERGIR